MSCLRIGLVGAGVVGGGVVEILNKPNFIQKLASLNQKLDIVTICVQSINKTRDFIIPSHIRLVSNVQEVLDDPSIDVIVELIGGVTQAKDLIFEAIKRQKHIVTANKALIATNLLEIQQLLLQHPNVCFTFEAAVCGGIPIIHSLHSDFLSDEIEKIQGIMNGTTNFMLSKMEDEGSDYLQVLKEAQRLGFAEADPTADVEGHDVQAKIAILAKLGFGKSIPFTSIPTTGISSLSSKDFEYAKHLNATVKLIGTSQMNKTTKSVSVFVSPNIVPLISPLASVKGPGNMVLVTSENLQLTTFAGPGAGRYATANSVVNDLLRISFAKTSIAFPLQREEELLLDFDYTAQFYVRVSSTNTSSSLSMTTVFEENEVIIQSQLERVHEEDQVFTTEKNTSYSKMLKLSKEIQSHDANAQVVFFPFV